MNRNLAIVLVFALLFSTSLYSGNFGVAQSTNFFSIQTIPSDKPEVFHQYFSKYVDVLGVAVYASQSTSDEKVIHTANMLAQYLDNDEDGAADNQLVHQEMVTEDYAMILFSTESEFENSGIENSNLFDVGVWQNLFGAETHPNGAANGIFDFAIEEVFHLVSTAYSAVYPAAFGIEPGSEIADAMDLARGGRFLSVPSQYPSGAWYTYDDRTCDYGCQVIEYMYWAMTSILGAQDIPGRLEEIEEEWRLNTLEKVQNGDPAIFDLLTDPQYSLPSVIPDGSYIR
jgi:hypothetical protein